MCTASAEAESEVEEVGAKWVGNSGFRGDG